MLFCAGLGTRVGGLRLIVHDHRSFTVLTPVLAATLGSAIAFLAGEHDLDGSDLHTFGAGPPCWVPTAVASSARPVSRPRW